jgi:hypothetical protein
LNGKKCELISIEDVGSWKDLFKVVFVNLKFWDVEKISDSGPKY